MSDDFDKGSNWQSRDANTDNNAYLQGQAYRAALEQQRAETEAFIRGGSSNSSPAYSPVNSPATSGQAWESPGSSTSYPQGRGTHVPKQEDDDDDLLGFFAGLPLTAGLIAAGVAFVVGQSPVQWGAIAAGGLFAVLLGLGVAGVVLGYVLSLWGWVLGLGAVGAAVGFGLATMTQQPSAVVQQNAIGLGVLGLGAGLALGTGYRLVGALRR